MAQMVSPGGPRSALSGVLTVADLLKRTEAVPVVRDAVRGATARVSVSSLLRRESVAGGKAAPKDSSKTPAAEGKSSALISGKRVARGSAIAVGTLLTAGSVFGTVAVTETAHTTSNEGLGGHPGQGRLDQGAATPQGQLPAAAAALAQPPAAAGALDPGVAAPDSWVPVAFPSAQAAAPASTPAAPGAQGTAATPERSSTPAASRHQAPAPAAAPAATPAAAETPAPSQEQGGGLVDGLASTVNGLGDTAPVLKPVTSPVSSLLGGGGGGSDEGSSSNQSRSSAPASTSSSNGGGGLLGSLTKTVGGLLG